MRWKTEKRGRTMRLVREGEGKKKKEEKNSIPVRMSFLVSEDLLRRPGMSLGEKG